MSENIGALFSSYDLGSAYDEMFEPTGRARAHRGALFDALRAASHTELGQRQTEVSGYLFQQADGAARSLDGATHAWIEAWLPEVDWVGFDPTHNIPTGERHIRVAVGRDYADVPPTRGVFKGESAMRSELAVGAAQGLGGDATPFVPWMSHEAVSPLAAPESAQQ